MRRESSDDEKLSWRREKRRERAENERETTQKEKDKRNTDTCASWLVLNTLEHAS